MPGDHDPEEGAAPVLRRSRRRATPPRSCSPAIKRGPLSDDEVAEAIKAAGDLLALQVETDRVAANQLHYDDLLRHAQCLLRIEEVARLYQQHYGAVLVDEYQDLSLQQLDLAMRTCTDLAHVRRRPAAGHLLLGRRRAPRSRRPAAPECGEPVQLTVSYRSSPAVLAMVNAVVRPDGSRAPARPRPGRLARRRRLRRPRLQHPGRRGRVHRGRMPADHHRRPGRVRRGDLPRRMAARRHRRRAGRSGRRSLPALGPGHRGPGRPRPDPQRRLAACRAGQAGGRARQGPRRPRPGRRGHHRAGRRRLRPAQPRPPRARPRGPPWPGSASATPRPRSAPASTSSTPTPAKDSSSTGSSPAASRKATCPSSATAPASALDEEQRVLLVILSRARHGVIATRSSTQDGRFGPYPATPSRWWNTLAASATLDRRGLEYHLNSLHRAESA